MFGRFDGVTADIEGFPRFFFADAEVAKDLGKASHRGGE